MRRTSLPGLPSAARGGQAPRRGSVAAQLHDLRAGPRLTRFERRLLRALRIDEADLASVQQGPREAADALAVLGIADDRKARVCEVHPNLMGAPGDRTRFDLGRATEDRREPLRDRDLRSR